MWTHHLRYAIRLFARAPGFTTVAVVTLALGISASSAVFSLVDGVLLKPVPIDGIDRVVVAWETDRDSGTTREPASFPDYLDYRERSRQLAALGAFMGREVNFTPERGEPSRLTALAVTRELLPLIGAAPLAGRTFDAMDDRPGGPDVVLLGEGFWTRALGRDPAVIGSTVRLNDTPVTVVGVLPASASFGVFSILTAADYSRAFADRGTRTAVDVWFPLQGDPDELPRQTHPLFMIGRLAPGVLAEQAQDELVSIAAELEHAYPENQARGIFVEPLETVVFAPVRPALLVLLVAVALVLLVACANVANLLLARASGRRREVAVRAALGAGVSGLARQFFVESALLTGAAAVLGVVAAGGGVGLLVRLAPADIPRIAEASVDGRVLAVTVGVSVLVGLAFGMLPILQASRVDLLAALTADGGPSGSPSPGRRRGSGALVVAELALAVVLVVGAALLGQSLWRLQAVDPGFRASGLLKAEYQLPESRYPADFSRWPDFTEMHTFTGRLLERARALPGVEAAAIASRHPLDPGFTNSFSIVGREEAARSWPEISVRQVTPGYFDTLSVPLRRGRLLADGDRTDGAPVVVINAAAAERFFGEDEPIGQQLRLWGTNREIVGVIGDERFHGLAEAPPLAVYLPLAQAPASTGVLLVRTPGEPTVLAPSVRSAVSSIDPGLAVFGLEPLTDTLSRSVADRRFTMAVLVGFAGIALILAAVGIHGVLGYMVAERRREIGIRLALGAGRRGVLGLVMGRGMRLATIGVGLGLLAAWLLMRVIGSLLYGIAPTDPATFAATAVVLAIIAATASVVPAWRASRVDPMVALRE